MLTIVESLTYKLFPIELNDMHVTCKAGQEKTITLEPPMGDNDESVKMQTSDPMPFVVREGADFNIRPTEEFARVDPYVVTFKLEMPAINKVFSLKLYLTVNHADG